MELSEALGVQFLTASYLPRPLLPTESTFRGVFMVERTSKSWLIPSQVSSQFSSFKSEKGKGLPDISTKYGIRLLNIIIGE